ncbi:MAG: sugar phosphate isomerase/epimerase family protein [Lapillicoccus sp.]
MTRLGVTGIEVAPTTVLGPDPAATTADERAGVRTRLQASGLAVIGVQSLYFGHPELQLLATGAARRAFVDHTCGIADVCADLGGTTMVFGAPKNRTRGALPVAEAMSRAAETFHEIGGYCATRDVVLVPEALSAEFGGDFVHTLSEAAELVHRSDSPGIGLHVDTGTSSPTEARVVDLAGLRSVQVSGGRGALAESPDQRRWAEILVGNSVTHPYEGWISIELPPTSMSDADNLVRIQEAVALVGKLYA